MAQDIEKEAAAKKALELVHSGMIIGLGTGSSAGAFIRELIKRVKSENLKIECIATSISSRKMVEGIIPLISEDLDVEIDITFDGADKLDPYFNLIKGGGGALLREKLVALRSKKNVILADHTKWVPLLQDHPVPVEIIPFGHASTIQRINKLGYRGSIREREGKIILSDNGNLLYDILFPSPIENPSEEHTKLKQITGVVETGFFLQTAQIAYIGEPDGQVKIIKPQELKSKGR